MSERRGEFIDQWERLIKVDQFVGVEERSTERFKAVFFNHGDGSLHFHGPRGALKGQLKGLLDLALGEGLSEEPAGQCLGHIQGELMVQQGKRLEGCCRPGSARTGEGAIGEIEVGHQIDD